MSRAGKVRLERVDVAHKMGFGLVNPLLVKKRIEGQITWFYNHAMHQANTIKDGRIVENNFNAFIVAHRRRPTRDQRPLLQKPVTGLLGMCRDPATSVQSAMGEAIFQITGKRLRDLPYGDHDLSWWR